MAKIKVDKGVPMPGPPLAGRPVLYPWKQMRPGDSFFAPKVCTTSQAQPGLPRFTANYGSRLVPNSKWTVRTVTENGVRGVRCWRLK